MNFKTIAIWAFLIFLMATDFTGVAITIIVLWAMAELLDFAGTDPLVWEDRQRQKRQGGKTHLQMTEAALNKAEKAMKAGKTAVAIAIVEKAEDFLNQNVGPLDIEKKEERELIANFNKKHGKKLG
jgi:hypothetical protein